MHFTNDLSHFLSVRILFSRKFQRVQRSENEVFDKIFLMSYWTRYDKSRKIKFREYIQGGGLLKYKITWIRSILQKIMKKSRLHCHNSFSRLARKTQPPPCTCFPAWRGRGRHSASTRRVRYRIRQTFGRFSPGEGSSPCPSRSWPAASGLGCTCITSTQENLK